MADDVRLDTTMNFDKRSGTAGLPGQLNEVHLSMLFLAQGLEAKETGTVKKFYLGSNVREATNFDDIVFKWFFDDSTGSESSKMILLQAKHKENVEKNEITPEKLVSDARGPYNMRAYMESFLETKNNISQTRDSVLKTPFANCEFVFFTNVGIKNMHKYPIKKLEMHDILQVFQNEQKHLDFDNLTDFQISPFVSGNTKLDELKKKLKVPCEFSEIVNIFVQSIITGGNEIYVGEEVFKKYHTLLTTYVLEQNNDTATFRKQFLCGNNLPKGIMDLRTSFVEKMMIAWKVPENKLVEELKHRDISLVEKGISGKSKSVKKATELISEYTTEEVEEFLCKLHLFFKQPSERILESIIKRKICNRFPELTSYDCDLCFNEVYKVVMEWWRDGNYYLTETHDFYKQSKENLSKLSLGDLFQYHKSKYKSDKLIFDKNVIDFLLNSIRENRMIHMVSTMKNWKLNCSKLYQAMDIGYPNRTGHDLSFVIIDEHLFISAQRVMECFRGNTDVLVVEIDKWTERYDHLHDEWMNILSNNSNKRVIIIADKFILKSKNIAIDKIIEEISVGFYDLTLDSQHSLLDTNIWFQGNIVKTNAVVSKNSLKFINGEFLAMLISDNIFKIGKELLKNDSVEHYYIDRTFNRHMIKIKSNIFRYEIKIALSNLMMEYNFENLRVFTFSDKTCTENVNFHDYDIFLLSADYPAENFDSINLERIHWLEFSGNDIYWKKSKGGLAQLRGHIELIYSAWNDQLFADELKSLSKFNIVAGEPGMGKTTFLNKIASHFCRENKKNHWVIILSFDDHSKLLDSLNDKKIDENILLNFLKDANEMNGIERQLFDDFYSKGKVTLYFDGYDEIIPTYKKIVFNLLRVLEKSSIQEIWITTRTNVVMDLEDELGVFAHNLKPLSDEDQRIFLKLFWRDIIQSKVTENELIDAFIDELLKHFSSTIQDSDANFTGIPLHLEMIAEVYTESLRNICEGERAFDFQSTGKNAFDIYEFSIKKKYFTIWCVEKRDWDLNKTANKDTAEDEYVNFEREHGEMAMLALFNETEIRDLFTKREIAKMKKYASAILEGKEKRGIVYGVIDGKPKFVHRTYAEYFAARLLAETFELDELDEPDECVVGKFLEPYLKIQSVLRLFFDCAMARGRSLHWAAISGDASAVERILENDKAAAEERDAGGRTALHLAATYADVAVVRSILNSGASPDCVERVFGWRPLRFAAGLQRWDVVDALLLAGATEDDATITKILEEYAYHYWVPKPLHVAAGGNHLGIVRLLVDTGVDLDAKDNEGRPALHHAVAGGHLQIVKALLDAGARANERGERDETALHRAVFFGRVELVDALLDAGADTDARCERGATPLHVAVRSDFVEAIHMLLGRGADPGVEDENGETPLDLAEHYGYEFPGLPRRATSAENYYIDAMNVSITVDDRERRRSSSTTLEDGHFGVRDFLRAHAENGSADDRSITVRNYRVDSINFMIRPLESPSSPKDNIGCVTSFSGHTKEGIVRGKKQQIVFRNYEIGTINLNADGAFDVDRVLVELKRVIGLGKPAVRGEDTTDDEVLYQNFTVNTVNARFAWKCMSDEEVDALPVDAVTAESKADKLHTDAMELYRAVVKGCIETMKVLVAQECNAVRERFPSSPNETVSHFFRMINVQFNCFEDDKHGQPKCTAQINGGELDQTVWGGKMRYERKDNHSNDICFNVGDD